MGQKSAASVLNTRDGDLEQNLGVKITAKLSEICNMKDCSLLCWRELLLLTCIPLHAYRTVLHTGQFYMQLSETYHPLVNSRLGY